LQTGWIEQSARGNALGSSTSPPSMEDPFQEKPDWGLDFAGLLFYVLIEYTRLAVMYPVLAPLQLGKVSLLAAMLGYVIAKHPLAARGNGGLKFSVIFLGVATCLSGFAAHYEVLPVVDLWNMPEQIIAFFLVGRFVVNRWRQKSFFLLFFLLNFKIAQHGLRTYFVEHARTTDEMAFVRFGIIGGGGGFYDNSADLGVAMCVVFGLTFALMQAKAGTKSRLFYVVCMLAFGALILVCGSRGAIVGGAAIVAAAWIRSPKKGAAAPILLLFVLGLVYLMPHASRDRFESAENWQSDRTAKHRVLLWGAGVRMWEDYPVLGVGPGNFQYVRAASYPIPDPELEKLAFVCHSMYIQVLSELGTFGAVGLISIVVCFFWMNSIVRRRLLAHGQDRHSWEYCMASGLDLAMIGFLVSGAFVSVFWYPHIWILSGLAVGLNSATAHLEERNPGEQRQREVVQNLEHRLIIGQGRTYL
jgi:putative inorganic carbon (hco3(-)) transporter